MNLNLNPNDHLLTLVEKFDVTTEDLELDSGMPLSQLRERKNYRSLVRTALNCCGEPGLGLRLGQNSRVTNFGVFGYALLSCATVREQLRLIIRYYHQVLPDIALELVFDQQYANLRCHINDFDSDVERFYVEAFFASVKTNGDFLVRIGSIPGPRKFRHSQPEHMALYDEVFGKSRHTTFDNQYNELSLSKDNIDIPQTTADAATETMFQEHCGVVLRGLPRRSQVSSQVSQLLIARRGEFPGAPDVAKKLGMSETTLWRKLKQEGTSFQQLLDEIRNLLATKYLRETQLPVADIALLIGFDDVTNFRRAFRRWTGKTPSSYRTT